MREREIISYEEYHPYGTSAYRLMKSAVEAPPKRYRYPGWSGTRRAGWGTTRRGTTSRGWAGGARQILPEPGMESISTRTVVNNPVGAVTPTRRSSGYLARLARYHYGIDKRRTCKHITRPGNVVEARIYLGGYELYRRYNSTTLVEEVESQHLFEGKQRVLLVDDVIRIGATADSRLNGLSVKAQTLFRYQYSDHVGSACLELDHRAEMISYEEYHPYGTSAYRLMESRVEAPPKRYRYTAMEKDEESGLTYHNARYCASWLARWASADPIGVNEGSYNLYNYVHGNPIAYHDKNGMQPGYFTRKESEPTPWLSRGWEATKRDIGDFVEWFQGLEDKTGPPTAAVPIPKDNLTRPRPTLTLREIEWRPEPSELERQFEVAKASVVAVGTLYLTGVEVTNAAFPAAYLLPLTEGTALGTKAVGLSFEELGTGSILREEVGGFLGPRAVARGLQQEAEILLERSGRVPGLPGTINQRQSTVAVSLVKQGEGQYGKVVAARGFEVPDIKSQAKLAKALDLANPPEIIGSTVPWTPVRFSTIKSAVPKGVADLDAEQKLRAFFSNPASSGGPTPIAIGVSRDVCAVCNYSISEIGGVVVGKQNASRQIVFPYGPR